jgi:hypothetical protein
MVYPLISRADEMLARLDCDYGKDATYYVNLGDTIDDDGNITPNYQITEGLRVRLVEMTAQELTRLSASGIDRYDAVWHLRKAYRADVRPDHILGIEGHYYEILDNGVLLDATELLYTLATRRRPSLA